MYQPLRLMMCAAALAGVVAAGSSPASARPARIALTRIDGDTSGLRDAIAAALDDGDLMIVSTRQLNHTMDKLELDDELTDRDLRKLVAALDVDAVIQGVFDSRARKVRLTIFANATLGKPFSVKVGNVNSDKFRKLVRTTLVAKLAAVVPSEAAPAADEDAPPPRKPSKQDAKKRTADPAADATDDDPPKKAKAMTKAAKPGDDAVTITDDDQPKEAKAKTKAAKPGDDAVADADAPKTVKAKTKAAKPGDDAVPAADAPKTAKASDDAASPEDKPQEAPDADAAPRAAATQVAERDEEAPGPRAHARFEPSPGGSAHSANLVAVRLELGSSMSARSLRFKTTAFDSAPKPYRNAPAPGARFEGELYPFAFRDPRSVLAGLGVAGDFDQTVALTLHASDEMTIPLKTTERHYSAGLRYRLAFGHTPTSPTLTAGGGYGVRTFVVNRKALMNSASLDLPDVQYKLFDPGLAFRLPLGGRVAVTLGARALLVTTAGAIQRADQYGRAKILGGSASAGLEIILGDRVAVRLAGEAAQLTLTFDGTGTLANSRDGNPATIDVRSATDRYLGGAATLAVLY